MPKKFKPIVGFSIHDVIGLREYSKVQNGIA